MMRAFYPTFFAAIGACNAVFSQDPQPSTAPTNNKAEKGALVTPGVNLTPRAPRNVLQLQFLGIEGIARLPMDRQKLELPKLHRSLTMRTLEFAESQSSLAMPAHVLIKDDQPLSPPFDTSPWTAQLDRVAPKISAEAVLNQIVQAHGRNLIAHVIRRRCIDIFQKHPEEIARLIDADLAAGDYDSGEQALRAIGVLGLTAYEPKVLELEAPGQVLARPATGARLGLADYKFRIAAAATQSANQP